MSHTITIDTTQHNVSSVCVFQSNRAEVRRIVEVELKAGQNEVVIDRLPKCLDKDSIRVDGIGNAVIFDVIYSPPPPVDPSTTKVEEKKALKELRTKQASLESEMAIAERQAQALDSYSNSLTADKVDLQALTSFLDLYSEKKAKIHEQVSKVADELEELGKQIHELESKLYVDLSGRKRAVKVTVVVLAEEDGKAELLLSYVVSDASWTPLYDLRAKVSNDPKERSTVSVSYRASISQQTGEDWNDVDLTLSTASPLLGSDIPTLRPYHIGSPRPAPVYRSKSMAKRKSAAPYPGGIEEEGIIGSMSMAMARPRASSPLASKSAAPAPMIAPTAAAVEGAVSTTFMIEGKSTIPSDTDSGSQTHKVSIAVIDMEARLEWISIPKEQPAAFLQCHVTNTSPYVFLPGTSNVFMDDNFVCKSSIPSVSPQEGFSTSLGVDAAIKVTYHGLQKKTKTSTGSILGSKFDVTSFAQNISVKNTRGRNVDRLIVMDQIPVSEESNFKVTLVEPRDLGLPKERREVTVTREVKARWCFKGGENAGDDASSVKNLGSVKKSSAYTNLGGVEEVGVLEWVCELESGKQVELVLAYEVSAPAGQRWVTL
ncbi:hypothetical protein FRC02_002347 [Tulasnella sp. 418]|nr:hypothetical protein FRC02_002347 [Tulasnella sp. 418]